MDERRLLPALSAQFSLACMLYTVTCLMTLLQEGGMGRFYPLILLGYAPAVLLLNRLLLQRQRTMRTLVLCNAVVWLILCAAVLWVDGWRAPAYMVFAFLFCLVVTVQGVQLCLEPPSLSQMILRLDLCLVLLVLFVGCSAAMGGIPLVWELPIAAGCACAVVGVLARRVGAQGGILSCITALLAFGVILVLVWLLTRFVAAPAGGGLVALLDWLLFVLNTAAGLVAAALRFLASLMPQPGGYEEDPYPEATMPQLPSEEDVGSVSPVAGIFLLAFLAAAAVIVVILLLRWLGRLRVGGSRTASAAVSAPKPRRPSFWLALRRLLASWRGALHLHLLLWRRRDTPDGLFFLLERRCRLGPWHRVPGETPRQFLLRLHEAAQGDPELAAALEGMIPAVDLTFYGPSGRVQSTSIAGAGIIRRRIGRAVRRQFFQRCQEKLCETFLRKR